jgi:hypothetical protein
MQVQRASASSRQQGFRSVPGVPSGTYFLYTSQLDHLSNDAHKFGGVMTEIVVVP